MLRRISTTLDMIKVQHSVFALPWAFLGALYAADGLPAWSTLGWILLAMVSARSAAMAFNRVVDRRYDAENPRTSKRALPAGLLSPAFAAAFAAVMAGLLLLAAWRLNPLCLKLAPLALFIVTIYSYTKRFTPLCHFVLGLSLAIAPVGAWIAVRPDAWSHPFPWLLGAAVLFWIAGADILYACEDLDFDRSKGLHSIPAALGLKGALVVSAICHAVTVGALATAGWAGKRGAWWYGTTASIAALLAYEHAIVKPSDMSRVNRAFFHVNAVVSGVILAGACLDLRR